MDSSTQLLTTQVFLLAFTRIAAMVMTAPVLGSRSVPIRFRVALAGLLTLTTFSLIQTNSTLLTSDQFVAAFFSELTVGLILGLGLCGLAVSAGMLLGLGAMSGSFNEWRTERGLWMLGALFLFVFGGFYALVIYHQIADWLAGRAPLDGLTALDWFIGTSALTYKIRFLWAVTYWNRRVPSDA